MFDWELDGDIIETDTSMTVPLHYWGDDNGISVDKYTVLVCPVFSDLYEFSKHIFDNLIVNFTNACTPIETEVLL